MWVKHGSTLRRREVEYRPDFCLKAEAEPLSTAEALLANDPRVEATRRERQRLWLRGAEEEVLRVRPRSLHHVIPLATELRRKTATKGYLFFDVDHQPESRWMHGQGLFSMCRLVVGPRGPELKVAPDEDRWTFDYPNPDLRTVRLEAHARQLGKMPSFDDPLECVTLGAVGGFAPDASSGTVGSTRPAPPSAPPGPRGAAARLLGGDETIAVTDVGNRRRERSALVRLGHALRRLDPDVLVTHHGDRWDIPYLLRRIRHHGLASTVRLGRDMDPEPDRPDQQAKSIHTYGRWLFKTHAYYLRGRWHVDLSKKTLDADDDRKDLHGILYMARVSNRRAQDVNRNGAGYALQQMQIDEAVDRGVALPWKRNLAEDWKDAATLCAVDRGGQIMVPTPGLYEDVAACDFSGYYPNIVVRHNLSSDTINCACCPDGPIVPELNYHVCTKEEGHQATILGRLMPHRRLVKAILKQANAGLLDDEDRLAKARAVKAEQKALGVVCFGYFRYRNARFGCAEVHQAIQCYGRAGMTRARELAQREGFAMVHTLTDCVFLQKRGVTREQAAEMARVITDELALPMDVEGVYKWVVFLPSKTHSSSSQVGVPNRYYGLFEDGSMKVRGIEVQRHSTPPWVYDAQQAMLDVFAPCQNGAEFRAAIPLALSKAKEAVERLRRHEVRPEDLGLMVQATRDIDEYQANTATKFALQRLANEGTQRHAGEYVKFVVSRTTGPGPGRAIPVELLQKDGPMGAGGGEASSAPRTDRGLSIGPRGDVFHTEFYIRLLARSVETLLSPFGYEEERVFEWLCGRAASPLPSAPRSLRVQARLEFIRR